MGWIFAILGLFIGSFLNVVILRIPEGLTLLGRSYCPQCKRQIQWYDLIPVFSFLNLRGRCRSCKKPISIRYAVVELVCASLFFLAYTVSQPSSNAVDVVGLTLICVSLSTALAIFVIDYEHYIIPDKILLTSALISLVLLAVRAVLLGNFGFLWLHLLGAVVGALPLFFIWWFSKGKWLGFGDVKYMFYVGVVLAWPQVLYAFMVTFWLGSLVAIPLLLTHKKQLGSKLPLGVFISMSFAIFVLFGSEVHEWLSVIFYF